MPERQPESDAQQQCRIAVDRLLERYEWRLLTHAQFVHQTYEYLTQRVAPDARRAAMFTYCEALYQACSGQEGQQRQEQGYRELFRFLYDVAQQRYLEVSDEAAQRALVSVYTSFDRCRRPGTFLAFALQHLRDAAKLLWRHAAQQPDSLDVSEQPSSASLGEQILDLRQIDPLDQVISVELRERLRQCIRLFLERHPRAVKQFATVSLKYIDGLDDLTISRRLRKSVKSVYVMRSRALKKLQCEPEWRALAIDLEIVCADP